MIHTGEFAIIRTMSATQTTSCEFCGTLNPGNRKDCLACGAPLPARVAPALPINPARSAADLPWHATNPAKHPGKAVSANRQMQQAREAGEQVEVIGRKALYAYSLLWRTLAEAASIAMTSFALGLVGGITGTSGLAVPGAVMVGIGVGFAIKISLLALFSAPVGLLVGALVGGMFYLISGSVWALTGFAALFAFLAALLGGHNIRRGNVNFYEKLRPFIGAAGGLVFGLLGMLLGIGLRAALDALIVPLG